MAVCGSLHPFPLNPLPFRPLPLHPLPLHPLPLHPLPLHPFHKVDQTIRGTTCICDAVFIIVIMVVTGLKQVTCAESQLRGSRGKRAISVWGRMSCNVMEKITKCISGCNVMDKIYMLIVVSFSKKRAQKKEISQKTTCCLLC